MGALFVFVGFVAGVIALSWLGEKMDRRTVIHPIVIEVNGEAEEELHV